MMYKRRVVVGFLPSLVTSSGVTLSEDQSFKNGPADDQSRRST